MDERGTGNKPGKVRLSALHGEPPAGRLDHSPSEQQQLSITLQKLSSSLPLRELEKAQALEERFKIVNSSSPICICYESSSEGVLFGHFEPGSSLCSSVRQMEEGLQERLGLSLMKDCLLRLQASCGLVADLERIMEGYVAYLNKVRTRESEKIKELIFKGERFHELCQTAKAHLTFWSVLREKVSAEPRLRIALVKIKSHLRPISTALCRVLGGLTAWIGSILFCVLQIAHHQQWRLSKQLHKDISTAIEDYNRLFEYSSNVLHDNEVICNLEYVDSCGDSLICERFGICASSRTSQACTRNVCSVSLNKLLNEIANERIYTLSGLVSEFLCQHEEITRTIKHDSASNFDWEGFRVMAFQRSPSSSMQANANGIITVLGRTSMPSVNLQQGSPLLTFDSLEHTFIGQLMMHLATSTTLMLSFGFDKKLHMHKSLPQQGLSRGDLPDDGDEGQGGIAITEEQDTSHGILKHTSDLMPPRLSKRVQWHESLNIDSKAQLSLYYMDLLWTNFGSVLCSALEGSVCRGSRQWSSLGPLPLWSDSVMMVVVSLLESLRLSGSLPPNGSTSLQLVRRHLHCLASTTSWDKGFCDLLGTTIKDKCTVDKKPKKGCICIKSVQKLAALFLPLRTVFECTHYWKHHPHDTPHVNSVLRNSTTTLLPLITRLQALLSFSAYWLDSKLHYLLSSWSLPSFFILLHWDVPLLVEAANRAVYTLRPLCMGQGGDCTWGSLPVLMEELQGSLLMLESISKKLEALFTEELSKMSKEFFQGAMPAGRSWKKSRHSGVPSQPNSYVEHAVMQILEPVFNSTALLRQETQMSLMTHATVTMMESWNRHILKEEIVFSYYGAQQLQLDFSFVKYWLSSDASGLEEDVKAQLLSLDVFRHLDAAIHLLMLQPKKKKAQPVDELDVELESNISAVSSSSVISSFSGIDSDAYVTDVLMDKTIPNKQKWLDLRLRGGKSKKGLLPFCLKVQEME